MTKLKFLLELEKKLSALSQEDIEERLTFYSEIIEDRVEEGISEEDAVAQIGNIEEIAAQILAEHTAEPPPCSGEKVTVEEFPVAGEQKPKRTHKTWELVLLIAGSPIWFSLLIAVLAVLFSLFAASWAIAISLWAVLVSLVACAVALPIAAVYFICTGYVYSGLVVIGASLVCGGLGILFYYGCKWTTKGTALLTKVAAISVMKRFRRKEEV
jgi:uncharacterized membrane protein